MALVVQHNLARGVSFWILIHLLRSLYLMPTKRIKPYHLILGTGVKLCGLVVNPGTCR